jgi:hypothetical protein
MMLDQMQYRLRNRAHITGVLLRHLAELRPDGRQPLAFDAHEGVEVGPLALTVHLDGVAVVAGGFGMWHAQRIGRMFYMRWYADCGDRERAGCWDAPASFRRPSSRSGANPLGER